MQYTFPKSVLVIGAGNMGSALIAAWKKNGLSDAAITVVDKKHALRIADIKDTPEMIVLAVKPQSMEEILPELKKQFGDVPTYISIAAGKSFSFFEKYIVGIRLIRVMPNTPALIGEGISALCANENIFPQEKTIASDLFKAVGEILWLEDESLLNAVTAISGSGPAYVFLFLESLIEAGKMQGLPEAMCKQLAIYTLIGSGKLALQSMQSLAELRANVTSKGGTTEAALEVLMKEDAIKLLFKNAIVSAVARAHAL